MRHVRVSELRRDADLSSDDNVQLLIDSFHDRRGAFVFGTNPNGAMWDAQLVGIDNLNQDWNGIWDVFVTRDSAGWTAVFRIPLRTLRFHQSGDLRFGFNVRRFIRRKNEQDLWRSWGRAEGLYQLLNEGELTDLGALNRVRDVEAYPYILTRATAAEHDSVGAKIGDGFLGGKAGLDVKVPVTPTVTADLTTSTDFAQVEADQQVINLSRFPFFFPEKREFFLESSGLFDFGTPGRVQVFYSRRIGLDTAGAAVPIIAGGRVTGRVGPWRLGLLDAQTGGADRANDAVDNFVSVYRIDPGFTPPLGFVRRTGIWETTGHTNFTPRPHALGIRQLDFKFIPEWDIIADRTGSLGRTADWQTAFLEWRFFGGERENGDRFEVNFQRLLDAPSDTFDIFREVKIPPGRYWWSRWELQYFMSPGRPLGFGVFVNWGGFYGCRSADLGLQGTWRGGGHVIVSADLSRAAARLPRGWVTAALAFGSYDI